MVVLAGGPRSDRHDLARGREGACVGDDHAKGSSPPNIFERWDLQRPGQTGGRHRETQGEEGDSKGRRLNKQNMFSCARVPLTNACLIAYAMQSYKKITEKQALALRHSYSAAIKAAVKDFKKQYAPVSAKFDYSGAIAEENGGGDRICRLSPRLVWQQDGATAHWCKREMCLLKKLGFNVEDGTVLVEELKKRWPAQSPDLNWLDQFVWGYMANELRYVDVRTKEGLIRGIKKIWREKITPEFCKKSIDHFFKQGDLACPWWTWGGTDPVTGKKTKSPCKCGGHVTIEQVIKIKGDRVSFARTADGVDRQCMRCTAALIFYLCTY